jgi:nucleotide-binding universal stress UspA family protein
MFKKILVPVDGSSNSWKALDTAKGLASKFGGELIVLHVVQTYSSANLYLSGGSDISLTSENRQLSHIGSRVLETARDRMSDFHGRVRFIMEVGHASDKVVDVAREEEVDSIVIGSRGLRGVKEFLLGSVSSEVSQHSPVPVLIVKEPDPG